MGINVTIDINHLADEIVRQPTMASDAGHALATARTAYEAARIAYDAIQAEVNIAIRKKPSDYGVDKITEGAVSSALALDPSVREAATAVAARREAVDHAVADLHAVDQRAQALSDILRYREMMENSAAHIQVGTR